MFHLIRSFLVLFIVFKFSIAQECSSQAVSFDATNTSFNILSDPNDLASKNCKYTFTVPKYFVPSISFIGIHLNGVNKITTTQYSDFGGSKSFDISEDLLLNLAPVNFTIELNLPQKTAGVTFQITITVKDSTPAVTGQTFTVAQDVGTLLDWGSIQGNSSVIQTFDNQNPQANSYSINLALFTEGVLVYNLLSNFFIYDGGVYKGHLLDVLVAQNMFQSCTGSQFAIVNSNYGSIGIFTISISQVKDWSASQIIIVPSVYVNNTSTYTATNGLTVFYDIANPLLNTVGTTYRNISFRGDGEVTIYAGCVTGEEEDKKIATISPSNSVNYEDILIYGTCKTYVLTRGVLQWSTVQYQTGNYRHRIGRKGVIMSNTYPYRSTQNVRFANHLIQAPKDDFKENIIVTYEVVHIGANVKLNIDQDIKANQDVNKTLSSSDTGTTFTSVSTYQQYITYSIPSGSEGFLVRYTVTSSGNISTFFGAIFLCCAFLLSL
ncbi:CUB_2 domain-containing protein [Caenorhabditis elegans]|uniref:CUB_2 domain-containing protein n=1 Tax=Caenorhabditis elegans TaxID=6239 RepID=Q9XUF6_CAEEL|nr:CUB_2 domain-containing protein [Caenorhabditis elegans]CAB05162.1 CUB_2 domain-containing protein [Caenorhabditis elegans]|eukprot:NP_503088.1 Uncharacterized protein CELE_C49C3.9 [Caenorhabditis elegans]